MVPSLNPIFDSPTIVANYLYSLKPDISPIKLQKALYFLFAYHGGVYFNPDTEGESEGVKDPYTLFNAEFEAWKYGPVIREIYHLNKEGNLGNCYEVRKAVATMESYQEEKKFIDNLFGQIDSVSDFSLVERSHQDEVWKNSFHQEIDKKIMDSLEIIVEYKEKYI